jgi:DNA-binding GntR family transcriptional regulator
MARPAGMASETSDGGDGSMRVGRELLTLRERATDVIRRAIIDHRLPPGTRLKERELCEMLGVSRTSVREALRHLESEQLIRMVPHKGPMVVALTSEDARKLYEVRASLEGLVGELFARNASDAQIARLRAIAAEMAEAARSDSAHVTLAIIESFYQVLFEGADNSVCAQLITSLNSRIAVFRRLALASAQRRREMMADIDEIVKAAVARDAEALKLACTRHVAAAYAAVRQQLAAGDDQRSPHREGAGAHN